MNNQMTDFERDQEVCDAKVANCLNKIVNADGKHTHTFTKNDIPIIRRMCNEFLTADFPDNEREEDFMENVENIASFFRNGAFTFRMGTDGNEWLFFDDPFCEYLGRYDESGDLRFYWNAMYADPDTIQYKEAIDKILGRSEKDE